MIDILKLNSISKLAGEKLQGYNLTDASDAPQGILVRSFNMNEYALPSSVLAVARAGAGVNNIPHADYAKKGVCVFNTPGANANAVKELVLAAMLVSYRNIFEGISWAQNLNGSDVQKQVEKGKSQFAGNEIIGKTLCILGLGAIGRKVAISANALGMNVIGFDPYLSDTTKAEIPFVTVFDKMADTFPQADFVTLHMPMTAQTQGFINKEAISKMKDGVIIINAARGELVNDADVKEAIAEGKVRKYFTDFPSADVIGVKNIITTPHLGASSEEAEDNCAEMAAAELKDYLENGNIKNSVNMPNLTVAKTANHRYSVVSLEGTVLGVEGISATRNGISYTIIDSNKEIDTNALMSDGVIKVRAIF